MRINIKSRKFLVPIFVIGIFILISALKILIFNDISVEPISAEDNPDFKPSHVVERQPTYLISYADGPEVFFKNQNTLAFSALNKGIDFIYNYRRSHIDPIFYKKNAHILEQKRGAGYWLWKPYIILKTLENAPENAVIIYLDSGMILRGSAKPFLELAAKHDIIVVRQMVGPHGLTAGILTKRDALVNMKCDTADCRKAPHIWGAFMVLRNTPTSRNFVKQWVQYCENANTLTDIPSILPNHPEFSRHQHDEAILSIHCYMQKSLVKVLPIEALYPYIIHHHRHPGNEFRSLLPTMKKHINILEQVIFNLSPCITLRKFFLEKYFTNHFEPKPARKD